MEIGDEMLEVVEPSASLGIHARKLSERKSDQADVIRDAVKDMISQPVAGRKQTSCH